jgi:hypothetical protein
MKKVTVRQLLRKPKEFLIEGEFILTQHGNNFLKVCLTKPDEQREVSDRCKFNGCEFKPLSNEYCLKHGK